jgi:hypothetical protein
LPFFARARGDFHRKNRLDLTLYCCIAGSNSDYIYVQFALALSPFGISKNDVSDDATLVEHRSLGFSGSRLPDVVDVVVVNGLGNAVLNDSELATRMLVV